MGLPRATDTIMTYTIGQGDEISSSSSSSRQEREGGEGRQKSGDYY